MAVHSPNPGGGRANYIRWKGREEELRNPGEHMVTQIGKKQTLCILKLGFPLLPGVLPSQFFSSSSKYSNQEFSLTPPFCRKLFVLPSQLVSLERKIQLPFLWGWLISSFQVSASAGLPATQGKEAAHAGSGQLWLGPLASLLLPPPACSLSLKALYHKCHFPLPLQQQRIWQTRAKIKAGFPSSSADCSLETHPQETWEFHTRHLQLLLAIKTAASPAQAASFHRPSQMTFHPSWSLS